MIKDNAIAQTERTPVGSDNVVFVSPSESLVVNLQNIKQHQHRDHGRVEIEEEVIRVQFVRGRYSTADSREIELLRTAPNNVATILDEISEEFNSPPEAAALSVYKDRFYEVTTEGA